MTPTEETAAKKQYAEILLKVKDPFAAALILWPDNTTISAWVAKHWTQDPEVIAYKEISKNANTDDDLPTKSDLSKAIWEKMEGPCMPDDFAKLGKLYAEINNMIEKPVAAPSVTANIIIPKVIEIPNHGTDENWEALAQKQQKDLLSVSRSKN